MNIWKPVAIGCIGYIAGMRSKESPRFISNYSSRRSNNHSFKDELIDIFSGKIYQLVYGETRNETWERLRERRLGRPVSYAPVYQSAGGGGSYADYINRKHDEESEENEDDET